MLAGWSWQPLLGGVGRGVWSASRLGTYDLKGVGDDADGHQLLAVVAAVGHQGVGQTLDDGAVGLAEPLDGISAGGVRQVDGVADLDVVAAGPKGVMLAFGILCCFFSEQQMRGQSKLPPS